MDLRKKLQRLGVSKGTKNLKSPEGKERSRPLRVPPIQEEASYDGLTLQQMFPNGRLAENEHGQCFIVEKVYPLDYVHGRFPLAYLTQKSLTTVQNLTKPKDWPINQLENLLFIDTETTGLRGAGTIPFMIGVAFLQNRAWVVRQFFLRDHGDETAALAFLVELVNERSGLVTFNGRSFDLPLLDGRLFMNRLFAEQGELVEHPHLDLLPPARKLWRERYDSCSLGSLEGNVLGLGRTQDDVPGHLIPYLYNDYLHTQDPSRLRGVFYHNHQDMLSMITLMGHTLELVASPHALEHPLEALGLAKWCIQRKEYAEAERLLHFGLSQQGSTAVQSQLLRTLSALLKKLNRRQEARPFWEHLAKNNDYSYSIDSSIELAKLYEWHDLKISLALHWSQQALEIAELEDPYNINLHDELKHRIKRLRQKELKAKS